MEIYKNLSLKDLPNEEWRDVVGYEGLYKVSNMGRVKMLERSVPQRYGYKRIEEHLIKQILSPKNYLFVDLWRSNKNKRMSVHRLVLQAFSQQDSDRLECNHINEIRLDNRIENLEWLSHKDNLNYGTRKDKHKQILTNHPSLSKSVLQYGLDGEFIAEYPSLREAGRQLNISMCNIKDCCKGRYKKTHGFIFKYK